MPDRFRTITESGSESPTPPMTTSDVGDHAWAIRWHKREALLRDFIAHLREPAIVRRVLASTARDTERAAVAAELEAILAAAEPIAHGGLPI